jgi:hypothetical protein
MREILIFTLGWVLFVLAQAQNSVRSTANGLTGWPGLLQWLKLQAVNLATRAFFSAVFYAWIMQLVTAKLQAAGLGLIDGGAAGVAGYAANAMLYQAFGLLPWLRVEVQDLAPPQTPPSTQTIASVATSPIVPPKGPTP